MEKDDRFSHVATDPKFRRIPKGARKVKIDKRFQSMFKEDKFKVKYSVDKRGRPVNHTSTEDLKRYYELSSEDEDEGSESEDKPKAGKQKKAAKKPSSAEKYSSEDDSTGEEDEEEAAGTFVKSPEASEQDTLKAKHSSDKIVPNKIKKKLKNLNIDYARGEGTLLSDSSSDDNTESEAESESEEVKHEWGELDKDAVEAEEITRRLAVCNMDWDRIRATDLMVLLNSFSPSGGVIESVTIYPSEYGKERMKEEELKGPIELVECKAEKDEDEEDEEGSRYHMEKLRQYQLNRLKYYYAVVVTDSPTTADHIYEECNGLEYESSATKMDLRFIPDDTTFDEEPKESCSNLPDKYEPRFFTTTALQQVKVQLTWDENDLTRSEITEKIRNGKIDDISEADLQNYLASSSGEESDIEGNEKDCSNSDEETLGNKSSIDKYKMLLQEVEKEELAKKSKDIGLEISWGIDLKEKTEKLVKKKQAEATPKTPFEELMEKKKEKKKAKREEKKKLREANKKAGSSEDEYSDDVPSDIDMNDPYFAEEFNNPEFKKKKKPKVSEKYSEKDEEDLQKQAELELLLMNDKDDNKKHFNLKSIQQSEETSKSKKKRFKKKKNKEDMDKKQTEVEEFNVDVADKRFSALYSSHHFNIDPTDPHFKKTKGMQALIEEKLKRRNDEPLEASDSKKPCPDTKSKAELNVLVKSIKRKSQALKMNKKT